MLASIALALALAAPACTPSAARQFVTVDAASTATTVATVRLWSRPSADACWRPAGGPWTGRVGRNGLSAHHREGDGTTPLGTFGFGRVVYGLGADPGVRYAFHRLVCGDWWDEDPRSQTYNRFRHVRCGARPPFGGGSEALWQQTTAYRYFAVIAYNTTRLPGRGSAIFLHADTGRGTNGCVSLPLPQLERVLRWLDPHAHPRIEIDAG